MAFYKSLIGRPRHAACVSAGILVENQQPPKSTKSGARIRNLRIGFSLLWNEKCNLYFIECNIVKQQFIAPKFIQETSLCNKMIN